jgi:limonene-1,2-epoxide hydrolase
MNEGDADKIARLRRGYEAFNRGDFDAAVDVGIHPDIEYIPPAGLPPVRGIAAFRAWMEPDAFELQLIEPREIRIAGNKALVLMRVRTRGAGSGIEMELDSWTVWTIDDAGLAIRVEAFGMEEEAEARRAAGLDEQ